jgi:Domain of unknown function (DUF4262)
LELHHRTLRNLGTPRVHRHRPIAQHLALNTQNARGDIESNRRPDLSEATGHSIVGMKCHFIEVNPRYYSDYIGFALWYYRKSQFSVCQIVWPDRDGLYPWDPLAAKPFKEWQPVLGNFPPVLRQGEPHAGER